MSEPLSPGGDFRSSIQRRRSQPGRIEKAVNPKRALSRLVGYLAPYRLTLFLVAATVALFSTLGLAGPWLMGRAIDKFIGGADPGGLARTALLNVRGISSGQSVQRGLELAHGGRLAGGAQKLARRSFRAHPDSVHGIFRHARGGRTHEPAHERYRRDQPGCVAERDIPFVERAHDARHSRRHVRPEHTGWRWRASWSFPSCSGSAGSWLPTRARVSAISRRTSASSTAWRRRR